MAIGGGAYTLSRIVLKRAADHAKNIDHFLKEVLPLAVQTLAEFMDAKIKFLVEESHFFKSSFLVEEGGFLSQENFTGMFGVVGLHEAVDILLQKEGKSERYGVDTEADSLGHTIMQTLETLVHAHKSPPYCSISGGHFVLHAQVGIDSDIGISRVLESLSAKRFHCTIIFVMQDNSIRTSLLAQVIFFRLILRTYVIPIAYWI